MVAVFALLKACIGLEETEFCGVPVEIGMKVGRTSSVGLE